MKKLLGLLFLIVSLSATAQYSPNPHNYGTQGDRFLPIKVQHIPEKDSNTIDDNVDTAQVFWNLQTHQFIVRAEGAYHSFTGGTVIDTTSLSNRINNCVLIANLPGILAPYLLSSSFDSMATALGYLKAFVQNSQLQHSAVQFENSPGLLWPSSGILPLGGFIIPTTDSNYLSTVNRLLDSIISVKTLIGPGGSHSDTTIRGKVIPTLTAGVLKYSTSCNCWVFDSTSFALDANVAHKTGNETIAGSKTFSSTITGATTGNVSNAQRVTDSTTYAAAFAALQAGKIDSITFSTTADSMYTYKNGTRKGYLYYIGNAATVTTNANMTGDVTNTGNVTTYNNIVPIVKGGTGTSTPGLVAGTNVIITGSWPNNTINATGGGSGTLNNNYVIPTAVKIANYRLVAHDFVPDSAITNLVDTLPNAPSDSSVVGVKMITQTGASTVTIITSGIDLINKVGGATSLTLKMLNQGVLLQYKSSSHLWYIMNDDLPLGGLDTRYQLLNTSTLQTVTTVKDSTTYPMIGTDSVKGATIYSNGGAYFGDSSTHPLMYAVISGASVEVGQNATPLPAARWSSIFCLEQGLGEITRAIGGKSFQSRFVGDSSFVDLFRTFPVYGDSVRWYIIGASNIINDCQLHTGYQTLTATIVAYIDSMHFNRGVPYQKIVLATPSLDGAHTVGGGSAGPDSLVFYSNAVIAAARFRPVVLLDTYNYMVNNGGSTLVSSDSIHPNTLGHAKIALNAQYRLGDVSMSENLIVHLSVSLGLNLTVVGSATVGGSGTFGGNITSTGAAKFGIGLQTGAAPVTGGTLATGLTGAGNTFIGWQTPAGGTDKKNWQIRFDTAGVAHLSLLSDANAATDIATITRAGATTANFSFIGGLTVNPQTAVPDLTLVPQSGQNTIDIAGTISTGSAVFLNAHCTNSIGLNQTINNTSTSSGGFTSIRIISSGSAITSSPVIQFSSGTTGIKEIVGQNNADSSWDLWVAGNDFSPSGSAFCVKQSKRIGIGGVLTPNSWFEVPKGTAATPQFSLDTCQTAPTTAISGGIRNDGTRIHYTNQSLGDNSIAYLSDLTTIPSILSTTTGINAKTPGATVLYTVPAGKTAYITGYYVSCTAASSITNGCAADIGDNTIGAASVVANQAMNALTGTTNAFPFSIVGMSHVIASGSVINFNINTAATGTSQTLSVDLIGYIR